MNIHYVDVHTTINLTTTTTTSSAGGDGEHELPETNKERSTDTHDNGRPTQRLDDVHDLPEVDSAEASNISSIR